MIVHSSTVAEATGLGVIFDDEMLPQSGVVSIPIEGPMTSSNDDLVCLAATRDLIGRRVEPPPSLFGGRLSISIPHHFFAQCQLGGVLPRAALLDMVGLIQDEGPHVRERGERGAIPQHDRAGEPR